MFSDKPQYTAIDHGSEDGDNTTTKVSRWSQRTLQLPVVLLIVSLQFVLTILGASFLIWLSHEPRCVGQNCGNAMGYCESMKLGVVIET